MKLPTSMLLLSGLVYLLLTACSGAALQTSQPTPTPIPMPVIATKPTYRVQKGEMIDVLKFPGAFEPAIKQELAFAKSGTVAKISVRRGDTVSQDQALAELETSQSEYDLRRAQTNRNIAQLRLNLARLQEPRNSPENQINIGIREQELELAQIAMDELNTAFADVHLASPMDGTVYSVSINAGDTVEANKPVIVVARLDDLIISADVGSENVSRLMVGMKANVEAVGKNISAAEASIQNLPDANGNSGSDQKGISTQITLDGSALQLGYKAGDMVTLTVVLEKKADALWLPLQALRSFENRYFAIVQEGSTQRRVDVKVGIITNDRIEITDGLSEGQVVVAP